jgi:hypothetical protein
MSAKDAFFKKVQENNDSQAARIERAKEDIQTFRTRMKVLVNQVEQWLKDSGVEITIIENEHHDDSVGIMAGDSSNLRRYLINSIRLKNGTKTAAITPIAIYGYGAAGRAALTLENPNRAPRTTKYFLTLDKDDLSWYIHPENQPAARPGQPRQRDLLTEESFFRAIETLA